jgi:hypothetical protein
MGRKGSMEPARAAAGPGLHPGRKARTAAPASQRGTKSEAQEKAPTRKEPGTEKAESGPLSTPVAAREARLSADRAARTDPSILLARELLGSSGIDMELPNCGLKDYSYYRRSSLGQFSPNRLESGVWLFSYMEIIYTLFLRATGEKRPRKDAQC